MVSKRFFRSKSLGWGYIVAFAILALIGLAQSRYLTNPTPRRMGLVGAVFCAAVALTGLYLKYRDRGKRHQEEGESKPR
jgi:hypothetical protein